MRNFDFSPLYRTTVGFDHLSSLLDTVHRSETTNSGYPPYNIERTDSDRYRITMAVAGFTEAELDIQTEKQTLTIRGSKSDDENDRDFLHRGIAARNFERRFQLADHVEVTGAHLANGLLNIELAREIPEAMKPKSIPIASRDTRLLDVSRSAEDAENKQDAA